MRKHHFALFLAAAVAAIAGPIAPRAFADDVDELAEGDWSGVDAWAHEEGSPCSYPSSMTFSIIARPTAVFNCTDLETDDPPPLVGPNAPPGTPTDPATPDEPVPGGGDVAPGGIDPEPPVGDPATTDDGGPKGALPVAPRCHAYWTYNADKPTPEQFEKETLLTLVLFRSDSFAFLCNEYCRSISTWYVDWFATTLAKHEAQKDFTVTLALVDECPYCKPEIDLSGLSELQAEVQLKTMWGGVDTNTCGSANAMTQWAGKIDCSAQCSANATSAQGGTQTGVGVGDFKVSTKDNRAYSLVNKMGGKAAERTLKASRTVLTIVNRGSVMTDAGGTEDNAQAKVRVGYFLKLHGQSKCGPWGQYNVDLKAR